MITLEKKHYPPHKTHQINKTNLTIIIGTITTFLLSIPIMVIP